MTDIDPAWFNRMLEQNLRDPVWATEYWKHRFHLEQEDHEKTKRELTDVQQALQEVARTIVQEVRENSVNPV